MTYNMDNIHKRINELPDSVSEKKDGILFRILFWPLFSMSDTTDRIHTDMDESDDGDVYLEENKRAIGLAGALGGCLMTLIWWTVLVVLFIVTIILLIFYLV